MSFTALPQTAAWQHRKARDGFEVVFFEVLDAGYRVIGSTAATEAGSTWVVGYDIELDSRWRTRRASITRRSTRGASRTMLDTDGIGHWRIDGTAASELDGCLDVDLESSALTNAFPVHRLELGVDQHAAAPAAYVRANDPAVDRLEQSYTRLTDETKGQRYTYAAPGLDFACQLAYDQSGLVLEYPGIAERAV